jgi:hypothetical protein
MKNSVLQEWVEELSLKKQSAILSSLRGPDNNHYQNVKKISKWIRRKTQYDADPSSGYMQEEGLPNIKDIKPEIEFCTVHYFNHVIQGLEIIGYDHPEQNIQNEAIQLYKGLARIIHLNPESREQLNKRLENRVC